MKKLLVPIDGSAQSLEALRMALREGPGAIQRIDLINVQPLLNRHVARWLTRAQRDDWRDQKSREALAPARRMVEAAGIEWRAHRVTGGVAAAIAAAARELRSDEIVLATARHTLLGRLLAGSVTSQVIAASGVPVRVVPTTPAPFYERLAVPAGLGLIAIWFWAEE